MTGRKGDIKLIICQNNRDRTLTIESAEDPSESNYLMQKMIGYVPDELAGRSFKEFLTPRINEIIDDYLEFEDDGKDLNEVLKRTRDFAMVSKSGEDILMRMRIQQDVCYDENSRFMIVMHDKSHSSDECMRALQEFEKDAQRDELTGFLNRKSSIDAISIVHEFIASGTKTLTTAVLEIDHFQETASSHDAETGNGLVREIVLRAREAFRETDILGYTGDGRFIVGLIEADLASSKIPLDRLREKIVSEPLFIPGNKDIAPTVSIACRSLTKDEPVAQTLELCEKTLFEHRDSVNKIIDS